MMRSCLHVEGRITTLIPPEAETRTPEASPPWEGEPSVESFRAGWLWYYEAGRRPPDLVAAERGSIVMGRGHLERACYHTLVAPDHCQPSVARMGSGQTRIAGQVVVWASIACWRTQLADVRYV